jgi:hypothetical protein
VAGQPIPTGIETDEASFARFPPFTARIFCRHCRQEHEWTNADAWVDDKSYPAQ